MTETAVYAAGGVVWRMVNGKLRILIIHRTKYRDLTLPKGKVDPGETLAETAVREIHEETGLHVSLGAPVGVSRYRMPSKKLKIVHYWAAHASDTAVRASSFVPNKEIAGLEWLSMKKARAKLSYPVDLEILEEFSRLVEENALETFAISVLRHARAGDDPVDSERPLSPRGKKQSLGIVGPLTAFGPQQIVSSTAKRCLKTVAPLSSSLALRIQQSALISQDAWAQQHTDARRVAGELVRSRRSTVVCSHAPVIPEIINEIALATGTVRGSYLNDAADLEPAAFSVLHVSASNPGSGIVAIETHLPRM